MGTYRQSGFNGGLHFIGCDTEIPEDAYQWLVNGRTREGNVKPIEKHVQITNMPSGTLQGIATLGNVLIVFVSGQAWYRLYGNTKWSLLGGFLMSTTADRYYTQVVPQSTRNFKRTLGTSGSLYDDIQSFPSSLTSGTPAGLVVQDGINQPHLIYIVESELTTNSVATRKLKKFTDWRQTATKDAREYVPIGKQMMWYNEKLFIVSRDGTQLYHSVSGRPLDFMVNVDTNGNKGASEATSGAASTSFTFDYEPITAIMPTSAPDSFLYTTANSVRLIALDYTNKLFGEPRYYESAKIPCGNITHNSVSEILGDFVFIDRENITAFNPVKQLKIEAKNSVFSKVLSNTLNKVKQTDRVCIGSYNDYRLFSIQSSFGPILAIFDVVQNLWVSFDITAVVRVKEFAVLSTNTSKQLFCITWDNKCFQLFADEVNTETCTFRTRAFIREELKEHKTQCLKLSFSGGSLTDTCRVTEYVDEQYSQSKSQPLRYREEGIKYPVRAPVIMPNSVMYSTTTFEMPNGRTGSKIFFIIQWTGNASLEELELQTTDIERNASLKQSSAEAKK